MQERASIHAGTVRLSSRASYAPGACLSRHQSSISATKAETSCHPWRRSASSGSPPDVFEASYSMFNNNLNADPLYSPGSSPPNIYVFVVNQGFGGGTLQGGNVQLAYYPHWQFALCAGIFSMFCTPQNSEMIETEVPLTLALINSLRVNPIAARVALRTTAVFNFLTMSVEYNIFGVERTLKLTAVRSRT